MGIESTHPFYDIFADDWRTQRVLSAGERAVKAEREKYLPPTPSMVLDGFGKPVVANKPNPGIAAYDNYIMRAVFPDFLSEAQTVYVGMLHHKEADIELPESMEPLRTKATLEGESLLDLLRRINREQLITGRIGLLADLPVAPTDDEGKPVVNHDPGLPFIATYVAEAIRNWDGADDADGYVKLNLVILDESGLKRDVDFNWKEFKKYRVLALGDTLANESEGEYRQGTFSNADGSANVEFNESEMRAPMYRGKTLQEIPFVIVNTRDLLSRPDEPLTLGLGKKCLAIYRGEADYRQNLFMTGQDTLVIIGGVRTPDATPGVDPEAVRVGAGSRIDVEINGDAKYVGVSGEGLSEQRECLENDKQEAATKSGQLIESRSQKESGEALSTRLTAQTASMNEVAITAAQGLERILKIIAVWIGADPKKVKVTPNMEFGDPNLKIEDLDKLTDARAKGFPISKKSMHQLAVERRLTKMTFEEEMELIAEEDAAMPRTGQGAATITADETLEQQEIDRENSNENAEADRELAKNAQKQKAAQK